VAGARQAVRLGTPASSSGPSSARRGEDAPTGPILGARVEHVGAKEALLADVPDVFFTTPHFDGYAAILVRLERIASEDLQEVVVEAWLTRAPTRLAQGYRERGA